MCLAITCLLFCATSAFARAPAYYYSCDVHRSQMPEGTVYVDMLIPIDESADEFTPYNDKNGEKYGISEDSEIVAYEEDGFASYTFHRNTARSDIKLIPDESDTKIATVTFYVAGESENYGEDEFGASDEFGEKYRKAKFAYVDNNGNILALTNEIDIDQGGYVELYIDIAGEKATADLNDDWIIPVFILIILFAPIILILILVILVISIFV